MSTGKPNIILITTDQQRYDTCGPRAPSFMRTPHFDWIANQGVSFSAAYADCPICVPSRTSIMSGKTVFGHGMYGNGETSDVLGREGTLPTRLRELGYQTCAVGKMHFGPERCRHGFDEMILPADYYNEMARSGNPVQPMRHGLGQNELYPGMATVPESMTLTSWTAEKSVEYIKDRRDPTVPFFLWCSFSKPHPPFDPPEPYYSMYRNCDIPAPVIGDWRDSEDCPEVIRRYTEGASTDRISPEILREARAAYYGLITQIDYNMGRVFAALLDDDLLNESVILYTSDHGEFCGDHRLAAKTFFLESSAHVPMAFKLPKSWGIDEAGTTVDHPVSHADVLPTLVAAAGGSCDSEVEGRNLIGMARGEITDPAPYAEGISRRGDSYTSASITDGRWKYCYFPEGPAELLFDLESDPGEATNLADCPEREGEKIRLKDELLRRHQERGSDLVKDGALQTYPKQGDTTRERRAGGWPGFHTERYDKDVRH